MAEFPKGPDQPTTDQSDIKTEATVTGDPSVSARITDLLKEDPHVIKIADIATQLGLEPVEKTLPNGRVVKQIQWSPDHLPQVFDLVNQAREKSGLGKNDSVTIDGMCPTWLLPTISHAWHPTSTAVKYPQGGPDAKLPLSGVLMEGEGSAENVDFKVEEKDDYTVVEFSLTAPQIDIQRTLQTLVAPAVQEGKAVHITGRGPIAIAASLAEAYAHKIPYVANFQPGVGFVVSISHDDKHPIGTVLPQ
ncbi:hypothetical protein GF369_01040 [Candidatus Peregrinibacteria bacterium]|nr:hypothetical protein [Candidatus Peregrinibacteria bacterium]